MKRPIATLLFAALALFGAQCGPPPSHAPATRSGAASASAPVPATSAKPPEAGPKKNCLEGGASPCISASPIRVGSELLAWSDGVGKYAEEHGGKHALGVTECRWVAEIQNTLLCASADLPTMNPPLLRAAIFIENKPRVVVRKDSGIYRNLVRRVGGFDLLKKHPRGTHPDLLEWFAALDRECSGDRDMCADDGEKAMRTLLEGAWKDRPSFVLITFAHRSIIPDDEVVSHEMLHAQYFTDTAFREVVESYWNDLPESSKAEVRRVLGIVYNAKDDELMQNELQAYALMSGGDRSRFNTVARPHRAPLVERLAKRGVTPIVVERRPEAPSTPELSTPEPAPTAPAPPAPRIRAK
jgi:hypothetical protein